MLNLLNEKIKKIINSDYKLKVLYIGIGNSIRGDDGIGQYIADKIKCIKSKNLKIINAAEKPENYLDEAINFKPAKTIFFDAANFCTTPGYIKLISEIQISKTTLSTHTFPLPLIANIIKSDTGSKIHYIGIQIKDISLGKSISKKIKDSADKIIKYITGFYKDMDYNKIDFINIKL